MEGRYVLCMEGVHLPFLDTLHAQDINARRQDGIAKAPKLWSTLLLKPKMPTQNEPFQWQQGLPL